MALGDAEYNRLRNTGDSEIGRRSEHIAPSPFFQASFATVNWQCIKLVPNLDADQPVIGSLSQENEVASQSPVNRRLVSQGVLPLPAGRTYFYITYFD
jgi:hypothetical protein